MHVEKWKRCWNTNNRYTCITIHGNTLISTLSLVSEFINLPTYSPVLPPFISCNTSTTIHLHVHVSNSPQQCNSIHSPFSYSCFQYWQNWKPNIAHMLLLTHTKTHTTIHLPPVLVKKSVISMWKSEREDGMKNNKYAKQLIVHVNNSSLSLYTLSPELCYYFTCQYYPLCPAT